MAKELVLMVDDELDNRVMMRYFLESWGYEVELAGNGEEALQKVAERRPNLVLLDLEMPVMDGFAACNQLKENPETADIPVIMFTGLEKTADKVKGIRGGADDYVVKTVDPEEIQARIEMILRRSRRYESQPSSDNGAASDAVLTGSLREKNFPEAFQLAMAYGQSGVLVLKNKDKEGRVYLKDGNAAHATYEELEGEDAFFELALWNDGQFSYVVTDEIPEATIKTSGTSLLMEATRRMDEWNLISSKIPSFDSVPHRVAPSGQDSIRLTRADWKVICLVDGKRTIREMAESLEGELFETGRTIFGLLTAGVLSFEPGRSERDSFFDAVPELREEPVGEEPFELSPIHWKLLSFIDGKRDLGILVQLVGLSPRKMAEFLKDLAEKGFIRVNKPRARAESIEAHKNEAAPDHHQGAASRDSEGNVQAFAPRVRAIGFD